MIFPDWGVQTGAVTDGTPPLYTEWAMDWDAGAFALRDGKPYTVTGDEALRVWVRYALDPGNVRFLYTAHSADYGNQLAACMAEQSGRDILESLLRREIRETLLVSPYITAVDGFTFTAAGSRLTAAFRVHTIYESFSEETEVVTV